ncbi:MAG: 1-acyl-sn-glycerol-3-phosphate acyltransferase [Merismopediaceae bacterium]|nr:1-acyl-sn-glycerol-3-phosphate acyltransferase [Merismopediaceae bacterium]
MAPLIRAQPPLAFIPPQLNPWVLRACQTLLPLWLQWRSPLTEITAQHLERLVSAYEEFQAGKIRLLLAFRHPSVNDPYCMGYLFWRLLPQALPAQKLTFPSPIHSHFMYDRGIPLWAGSAVGWLYSRLGGTSIQRGKLDIPGLRSARDLLLNSRYPLAAAPEGATNGHNEIISPLEPGIAQLGFWTVEDLRKAQRDEEVIILPVGIQYFYLTPPWENIAQLLQNLEQDLGIPASSPADPDRPQEEKLYQRLFHAGEVLLEMMENFYREFYHQALPAIEDLQASLSENLATVQDTPNDLFALRLQNLLNVALGVAEQYFNLPPKGNLSDRCRRLEQAGWDYIYREELKTENHLSNVKRGLADRVAEEANLRMWHMRLVETFVAVTGHYVKEKPSVERFADTLLLLWDVVTRIKGGNAFFRPALGQQRVQITLGEPLSVTARAADYQNNRRQAVAHLTQELQNRLESLITR